MDLDWEELQRDAARYRWLVANSFNREGKAQFHVWLHTWSRMDHTQELTEWKQRVLGPAIDRAIDLELEMAMASLDQATQTALQPGQSLEERFLQEWSREKSLIVRDAADATAMPCVVQRAIQALWRMPARLWHRAWH